MIVCVIGPLVSCHVFSFGDANISKKKDSMLTLSFFFPKKSDKVIFSKKSYIFGQLDGVLWDMVPAIGGIVEVLASCGLLKIYLNNIRSLTKWISWSYEKETHDNLIR